MAIADLTKAIEIEPMILDYISRANCHVGLGKLRDALPDYTRVVETEATHAPEALLRRGMTYELLDAAALALADYDQASGSNGPIGEYAMLWQYILLRQEGKGDTAGELLSSRKGMNGGSLWIDKLFNLLAGETNNSELLNAATTDSERTEAHYYIGRKALLDGRIDDARKAFAECVDLGRHEVTESTFARALLDRLTTEAHGAVVTDETISP